MILCMSSKIMGTDSVLEKKNIIGPKALKFGTETQNVKKECFY